jgi:hypothetical protein
MGLKGNVIGWLVTAFIMAVFWTITDMGIPLSDSFIGKIIVSLILLGISKFLTKILGD